MAVIAGAHVAAIVAFNGEATEGEVVKPQNAQKHGTDPAVANALK